MANVYPVCTGEIYIASGPAAPFSCSGTWVFKPEPATDFQGLIDLLQFDPEICALITGICVLFFIIGHAAGHTARQLSRH